MNSTELLALSPGALAQLEAGAGTSVRVRRVGSPEEQRALLRAGHPADLRVDTPMSLAEILKRKLPGQAAAPVQIVAVEPVSPPQPTPARGIPALPPLDPRGTVTVAPPPGTGPRTPAGREARRLRGPGGIILDCRQRPSRGGSALDGEVTQAGQYYRVRTCPFATRGEAEASLAKVRAAGYSDARILTNG